MAFRTADGSKFQALLRSANAAFEIDGVGVENLVEHGFGVVLGDQRAPHVQQTLDLRSVWRNAHGSPQGNIRAGSLPSGGGVHPQHDIELAAGQVRMEYPAPDP